MPSLIRHIPAASPTAAVQHFSQRLGFETDCSDVYFSQQQGPLDFILVDTRNQQAFAQSHVQGAINIPWRDISAGRMAAFPTDSLFVVYCAGPHCNGAQRVALRLAELGYPVKEMIGGLTGWVDEHLPLEGSRAHGAAELPSNCAC